MYISLSSLYFEIFIVIQLQNYKILVRQRICFTTYLQAVLLVSILEINGCPGQLAEVAPDKLSLKFLHFKFIAVHVSGWEIYVILHFELTLDFRFYS